AERHGGGAERRVELAQGRVHFGAPAAEADVDGKDQPSLVVALAWRRGEGEAPGTLGNRVPESTEVSTRDRSDELRVASRSDVVRVGVAVRVGPPVARRHERAGAKSHRRECPGLAPP